MRLKFFFHAHGAMAIAMVYQGGTAVGGDPQGYC